MTCEALLFPFLVFQDIIYNLKTAFNKEFDKVARQKEQDVARVKERNLRIHEILTQLELQMEVWEPALTDDEMPERALTVQDSEVPEKINPSLSLTQIQFSNSSHFQTLCQYRGACVLEIIFLSLLLPFPF